MQQIEPEAVPCCRVCLMNDVKQFCLAQFSAHGFVQMLLLLLFVLDAAEVRGQWQQWCPNAGTAVFTRDVVS
jgi:hypothetical protein